MNAITPFKEKDNDVISSEFPVLLEFLKQEVGIGLSDNNELERSIASKLETECDETCQQIHRVLEYVERLKSKKLPSVPFLASSIYFEPSSDCSSGLAGDIWKAKVSEDGGFCFFLGDASGHGADAFPIALEADSVLNIEKKGSEVMSDLNSHLKNVLPRGKFMVASHVKIAPNGFVEFSGGGGVGALILRKNGELESMDCKGVPLGIISGENYDTKNTKLNNGDRVYLFTDGIYERLIKGDGEKIEPRNVEEILRQFMVSNKDVHVSVIQKLWFEKLKEQGLYSEDDESFVAFQYLEKGAQITRMQEAA